MSNQAIKTVSISKLQAAKRKLTQNIVVGKDVLELLTGAMYVDPLSIYREYIQNATDGIDDAKGLDLYELGGIESRIDVLLDSSERTIRVRDNGIGVAARKFKGILTAIGGSQKRGTEHRGFRGVGRLSGLGYCQEMVFRSRGPGDSRISELYWDGRRLKELLNDSGWEGNLGDVVKDVTGFSSITSDSYPPHFFEVEMKKVIRLKNDVLLDADAVRSYIGQVCPVPFHPEFEHGQEINEFLGKHEAGASYNIFVNGTEEPVYRPHRNTFYIKQDLEDSFQEPRYFEFEGINGGIDAVGWLLEHDYHGAIPKLQGIHGIRFRAGNTQVGSDSLVAEEIFPETRFNSWSVGEVHVLNKRIIPNGRRDHFEQNVHFSNLVGQMAPIGKQLARKCRDLSCKRNRIKGFELQDAKVKELIDVISHRTTPKRTIKQASEELGIAVDRMKALARDINLSGKVASKFERRINKIEKAIDAKCSVASAKVEDPLQCLPPSQRKIASEIFELIYEVSLQKNNSRILIDKVTKRLVRRHSKK